MLLGQEQHPVLTSGVRCQGHPENPSPQNLPDPMTDNIMINLIWATHNKCTILNTTPTSIKLTILLLLAHSLLGDNPNHITHTKTATITTDTTRNHTQLTKVILKMRLVPLNESLYLRGTQMEIMIAEKAIQVKTLYNIYSFKIEEDDGGQI